jgi:YidC/Oxa1 family membrane protein insertase
MEKRLLLAVVLMGLVLMITSVLFPPPEPPPAPPADDPAVPAAVAPTAPARAPAITAAPVAAVRADTIVVSSPLYRYSISTRGAAMVGAELLRYESYVHPGERVQLVPPTTESFLAHRIVVGRDTVDLRAAPFQAEVRQLDLTDEAGPQQLRLSFVGEDGIGAEIVYTFRPDDYLVRVQGRVLGLNGTPATLLTDVGPTLWPHEAPDHRSEHEMAIVTRSDAGLERMRMMRLAPQVAQPGPLTWVGIRDKYFLAAVITGEAAPLANVTINRRPDLLLERPGQPGDSIRLPRADVTGALAIGTDGAFGYDAYVGPQAYERLRAIGFELEEITPYAYAWLQPIIQPFARLILWVLNFLHHTLGLGYGWVLVVFGVLMRIVLWPLNQKAMRAQVKNMAVQPMLQQRMTEVREKYKNDMQRQQQEMVKVYQELGVSPFSMLSGCLPLLIPMPILITLFFVFQNSIVFRGESFLWLPDLSLKDPLYILPVFLMVSMFGLQYISAKSSGMEQNPQMKMMMYFMPIMLGIIFFQLASGLNLYYATTNIATIPQQMLIGRERKRLQEKMKKEGHPAVKAAPSTTAATGRSHRVKRAKKKG